VSASRVADSPLQWQKSDRESVLETKFLFLSGAALVFETQALTPGSTALSSYLWYLLTITPIIVIGDNPGGDAVSLLDNEIIESRDD
jgi:hypothetical protein